MRNKFFKSVMQNKCRLTCVLQSDPNFTYSMPMAVPVGSSPNLQLTQGCRNDFLLRPGDEGLKSNSDKPKDYPKIAVLFYR